MAPTKQPDRIDDFLIRNSLQLQGNFTSIGVLFRTQDGNIIIVPLDAATIKIDDNGKLTVIGGGGTTGNVRRITANDTFQSTDNGGKIEVNATSDITLTVSTTLPNNFKCEVFVYGAGNVTYIAANGASVLNPNGLYKSNGNGSGNSIVGNSDSTKFIIGGDLKYS